MTQDTSNSRKYWLGFAAVIAIGITLVSTQPSAAVPEPVVQVQNRTSMEKEVSDLETLALDSKSLQPGMKDILRVD